METIKCSHCGQLHLEATTFEKTVWVGKTQETYRYCSTQCSYDFFLARLRAQLYT